MKDFKPGWHFPLLSKILYIFIFIIVFWLMGRCGAALYMPTRTEADKTGIMLDSLVKGRELYINHCGSCHNLYSPAQYTDTEWEKNVNEMQAKARITDTEKRIILDYLKSR